MIRHTHDVKDTAPTRLRPQPTHALAAVGVLAGLVVSAWGSLFAVHTLYPSYISAFTVIEPAATTPDVQTAGLDLSARTERVLSGLRLDEGTAPEAPQVELAAFAEPTEVPKLAMPAPEALDAGQAQPSPQDLARLSAQDASMRAGASLAARKPEAAMADPDAAQPIPGDRIVADRTAPTPIPDAPAAEVADAGMVVAPSALATASSLRPLPRPDALVTEAEVVQVASADLSFDDSTTSTMNAPSRLAVPTSPRPRALPNALRTAFAPTRQRTVEPTAEPEPQANAMPRIAGSGCGRNHARNMPNRRAGAATGSQFMATVGNGSGGTRDNAIITELARGNMPSFLHDLQPVTFRGTDARGVATAIVICVTPDYLALGSDSDFIRVPMGLPAAASIAGRFGMMLPTSRMVDAIYAQATVKLNPQPMQAGPQMSSTAYFVQHNKTIEAQRHGRMGLISGHKKDVVMASRMASNPGRVAIYGWHRSNGNPIQPVSTVHGASYADYSHGIRLVSRTAYLNGRAVDLEELLSSTRYASMLNSDGPLPGPVIRVASR